MNSQTNDNKENIKVIIRIRPKTEREYFDQGQFIKVDGNSIFSNTKNDTKQYNFDYVATEESSQQEMFDSCARNICESTLQGYNGTIFVYGQTGAGKTHTLLGPNFSVYKETTEEENLSKENFNYEKFLLKRDEDQRGILPRVIDYLFERSKNFDNSQVTFKCSFLEIYQEQIYDLLDGTSNKQIFIRDLSESVIVEGLNKINVVTSDEALNLVQKGIKLRHTGSTCMNKDSSRSHAVFSIYIENKQKTLNGKMKTKKSVFHLIDLAGSERQKLTETFGERLKEAGKINKSLMQLGHVIKSLIEVADGKKTHIHYRDSKLTHLLKDSLGGNSKTCIIANISPANCNMHETLSTLVFAQSAKLIKNKAVINEEINIDNAYKEEIKKLRDKYNFLKSENLFLLQALEKTKTEEKSGFSKGDVIRNNILNDMDSDFESVIYELNLKENQIKILQTDNDFLKEKIQSCEIELKIKEKELRDLRELSKSFTHDQDILRSQLNEYVLRDANMATKNQNLENLLKNKEFMLNSEIENLKSSIQENKRLVEFKESVISNLNIEIKNYMSLISQKDNKINELKVEIDLKQQENENLRMEIEKKQNKEDSLINLVEFHRIECESKKAEVKAHEVKYDQFRTKGKNLIDQYDIKIENLKLRNNQLEEDKRKNLLEIRNLNTLINELKKERDIADEKSLRLTDDVKRTVLEKETLKEEYFRLGEENRTLRIENVKLNEENELLSDNKNCNNNKVSLLNKLKQENSKLKEEVNELRKNFEYFDKTFNIKNNNNKVKLNPLEIASSLSTKEQELNECRRIFHTCVYRIKNSFENNPDEFSYTLTENMKNFIEGKTIEEKFQYYFEKQLKYLEYKEKKETNLKRELDAKDSKIFTLNREIFLRNTTDAPEESNENNDSSKTSKKRHTIGSQIINSVLNSEISKSLFKTNHKRKYGEINTPLNYMNKFSTEQKENIPNNFETQQNVNNNNDENYLMNEIDNNENIKIN